MNRWAYACGLLIMLSIGGLPAVADELSAEQVEKLLKQAGDGWSVAEVGFAGFQEYKNPGDVIYVWPAANTNASIKIQPNGKGTLPLKLAWQLRPGASFPQTGSNSITYQWGEPEGKAYGFSTVKIDKSATSGEFTADLSFSTDRIGNPPSDRDVIVIVTGADGSLGNFLRLKLQFRQ